MTPHNWYRLLPVDLGRCDDFVFVVGQSWELIKPLLVQLGYPIESGGVLEINADNFVNLQHVTFGGGEITSRILTSKVKVKHIIYAWENHILVDQLNKKKLL